MAVAALLAACPAHAKSKVGRLVERLESARGEEQFRLVAALGRSGSHDALKPLLGLFDYRKAKPKVSLAVIEALGALKDKGAVSSLVSAWDYAESVKLRGEVPGPIQAMRAAIVESLGLIGEKRTADLILRALGDDDPLVSRRAIEACARLKERRSVELLIQLMEREGEVGWAACEALGEIGDNKAKSFLQRGLKSEDPFAQAAAAYSLARMGDKDARGTLKSLMIGADAVKPALRAAYYLARLDEDAGFDQLLRTVHDRKSALREAAADFLGKTGNRKVVNYLIESLGSGQDPALRLLCVRALGGIGGPKAVHSLYRASEDKDANLAAAARAALTGLGEFDD